MSGFRYGGREEVPHARAAAEKSYPTSRERWLRRRRRAERSYSTFKVRRLL